jgi:hypothetical protein
VGQFTIDATGITVPRLADARTRVVELWREHFGAAAETDVGSPDGDVIDTLSLLLALAWQGIAASSSNAYGRTAEGVFKDLILDLFARSRLTAAASTASLVFYGTDATVVGLAALAQVGTSGGARFATDEAATIGAADETWVVRVDALVDSFAYTITVNGDVASHTDASATRAETVAGLIADLEGFGYSALDGGDDDDDLALIVIEGGGVALAVTVSANLTAYPAVRVAATCTETGPTVMLAGDATLAVAISGVVGVCTTADASVGRDREGDGEFWDRHLRTLSANGTRTSEALAAKIADLAGVEGVAIYDNEAPIEVDGRPPHSFEPIVLGGDTEEIAALILANKPAGIRSYGTTTTTLTTANGDPVVIGLTRPTELYLHVEVTITPGEGYPTTGTPLASILTALATYLGGAGKPRQGQDLYRVSLYGTIVGAVTGVGGVSIRLATTAAPGDPPTFAAADLTVDEDEILRADSSRITVL